MISIVQIGKKCGILYIVCKKDDFINLNLRKLPTSRYGEVSVLMIMPDVHYIQCFEECASHVHFQPTHGSTNLIL